MQQPGALKKRNSTQKTFSTQIKDFFRLPKNNQFFLDEKILQTCLKNRFFTQRKNILYLPSKKKKIHPKKKISYNYPQNSRFSKRKFFYTCPKKFLYLSKKKTIFQTKIISYNYRKKTTFQTRNFSYLSEK